ncbi:hypothetical protein HMPREF1531_00362 [Propionibacterium sp. oral taxon 192 str. F0372]|uniref:hypothetical protein n=1 Tax=Propionibacterium sp. oral taxon 192 TaxID=671222 RepID=UPI000353194B|nr:hypothetical protein [Propionibacterium sp. oral taxon 192]EPH06760.1 hypothetical protein HMPREF1531_00362 [Propionibacterium sp. oral taxon 192 str. F0372]
MSTPVDETQGEKPAPRSGVAPTDTHGGVPFSNGKDIQDLMDQLRGLMDTAIATDRAEVEIAKSCVPRTWYCTAGYDAATTMERFGGLEKLTQDKFAELQGLVEPYVRTADVVEHNMTSPFARWKAAAAELASIAEEVRAMVRIPEWSGQAADAYAANTFYRADQARALADLASNAKGAVESVCIIQATLGSTTADEIFGAINDAKRNLEKWEFHPDKIRSKFDKMSRNEFFAWDFYIRTSIVESHIQSAIAGVESIGHKSQEWQKVSQDTNEKLAAALAEARRWMGSRADYITQTTVETADVCGTGFSGKNTHFEKSW